MSNNFKATQKQNHQEFKDFQALLYEFKDLNNINTPQQRSIFIWLMLHEVEELDTILCNYSDVQCKTSFFLFFLTSSLWDK